MDNEILSSIYVTNGVDTDKVLDTLAELEDVKKSKSSTKTKSSKTAAVDHTRSPPLLRPTSILVNAAALQLVDEEGFCDKSAEDMSQEILTRIHAVYAEKILDHRDKHEQERDGMDFIMWRVTQNLELQDLDELIDKALAIGDATTTRSENY
ncbi:hypothetical protein ACLI1L_000686 [Corynebacterium sp. LaCa117]|uniref:hypothetical protein n=1 Tax=Corynebacterium TaxID=1716 RepID=UPI002909B885|nr:hypothetical protein [Corynebacterium sp.]MDU4729136.1 hypothetical protein [Corynebacterium sp.]